MSIKKYLVPFILAIFTIIYFGNANAVYASSLYANVPVSDTGSDNSLNYPNTSRKVAAAPNGYIYVVYYGSSGGIRVARSTNRGQSFDASVQVTSTSKQAEIAVDANNVVYVAWSNGSQNYLSRSTDDGVTFSTPAIVGPTSGSSAHLAVDAPYVYIINPAGTVLYVNGSNGVGSFTTTTVESSSQAYSDVQVDPVTKYVYVNVDNPSVKYFVSSDHGQSFGSANTPGVSIYYSTGVLASSNAGDFLLISGQGTTGESIDLNTNSSTALTFQNNTASQGRTLAADSLGNIVDGYVSGATVSYAVSTSSGASFNSPVTVTSSANYMSVAINPVYGDIDAAFETGGKIYLSVYQNELSLAAASADLSAGVAVSTSTAKSGNAVNFSITVHNNSYTPATSVVVTTTLPTGFTVTGEPDACSGSGTIVCSLASLSAGATSTFSVSTTVNESVALGSNTITTIASSTTNDPDLSNNITSTTITILSSVGPVISVVTSTSGTTSTAVTWETDETASSQIVYSPDTSYTSSTAIFDTETPTTTHGVTLSNLVSCTLYHYKAISIDGSDNTTVSPDQTFITLGCSGAATVSSATSTSSATNATSTVSLTDSNNTLTVTAPSNFTATSSNIIIQIKALDSTTVLNSLGTPSSNLNSAADIVFDVKALIDSQTILDSFDLPVTISYHYSDSEVAGLDESTLWMYHYHNGSWAALDSCTIDQSLNTITCTAPSFSAFAIFGQATTPTGPTNGGGGMILITPKALPQYTKLDFTINNSGNTAANNILNITMNADPKYVSGYAITLDKNFVGAGLIKYSPTSTFTLPQQNGTYIVYLKYYSTTGNTSEIISHSIEYKADKTSVINIKTAPILGTETSNIPTANYIFKRNLKLGMTGSDIKELQKFLNNSGFIVDTAGVGSPGKESANFGTLTQKALINFQKAYNIKPAIGYFGPLTRGVVNIKTR